MIDEDFAALEQMKVVEIGIHKVLLLAKHPKLREHAEAMKLQAADALESTGDRSFPRPVKRVHHLRPAPAPGTQDGLGPVA